jgi:hypothetical protein
MEYLPEDIQRRIEFQEARIDRVWALHVLVFRCTRYEYSHSCLTIMPNMPNGMLCTW